jgi:hypothetical protein
MKYIVLDSATKHAQAYKLVDLEPDQYRYFMRASRGLNEITGLLHAMALDKKKLQTIEPNPGPDQPKHPGSDEQQANKTPKSKAHR